LSSGLTGTVQQHTRFSIIAFTGREFISIVGVSQTMTVNTTEETGAIVNSDSYPAYAWTNVQFFNRRRLIRLKKKIGISNRHFPDIF
jgi:hypothetical protein